MKITLNQTEIEAAIKAYVLAEVSVREGVDLTVDFTATRGSDGIMATIDIPYMGVTSMDLSRAAPETTSAPRATQPKPAKASKPVTGGIFGDASPSDAVAENAEASDTPTAATEGNAVEEVEAPPSAKASNSLFP